MIRIAVDAMGGDWAPAAVVEGAVRACREHGLDVTLVGDETRIRGELIRLGAATQKGVSIRHAADVVEMSEQPAQAIRKKQDASMRVAFELVKRGEADAVFTAGHSGAALAAALLVLGRLPSVERPAVIALLPTLQRPLVLLDAGANVEVRPIHLAQFARIGEVYARRCLGVERPRIAILSNGEEASKGTALTRIVSETLERDRAIDFRGSVEGKDLFTGACDVVVTDGFTGNVVLKTAEGAVHAVRELLRRSVAASGRARLGALFMRSAFDELRDALDWNAIGGAPLVGCDGTVFLAHGRSGAQAVCNALRSVGESAGVDMREEIARACAQVVELLPPAERAVERGGSEIIGAELN